MMFKVYSTLSTYKTYLSAVHFTYTNVSLASSNIVAKTHVFLKP